MRKIKRIYDGILYRLGFRETLTNDYIDSVRIKERGDHLHWYGKVKVRSEVAKKLARVKNRLKAKGYELDLIYGYLNLRWQQKLLGGIFEYHTGGAVSIKPLSDESSAQTALCSEMIAEGFVNHPKGSDQFHYGDKIWAAYSGKRRAIYGDAHKAQTKSCVEVGCPYYEQYHDWLTGEKDRTKWEDEHPKPCIGNGFEEYYNPHCTECMENNLDDCANCDEFWEYYAEGDRIPDIIYDRL